MDEERLKSELTRRAALMLAAATPALAQPASAPAGRPVIHFEIGCKDSPRTAQYYSELFGWKMSGGGASTSIDTGSQAGIQGHINSLGHEPFHYTTFYVGVEDVKASLDKAVALGGKAIVGPVKFPGGTFAWFSDPEGNMIGLLKPA